MVAGWALGITLVGHGLAGGGLPPGPTLLPLGVVSLAAGCVVAGRQVGFTRALATLLLLQPLLHLELHTLTHPVAAAVPDVAGPSWQLEPAMLLAHLVAAVAGAAWIAWADGWLARVLGQLWPPVVGGWVPPEAGAPAPVTGPRRVRLTHEVHGGLGSRGPPAACSPLAG